MINRDTLMSVRDAVLEVGHDANSFFRRLAHRSELGVIDKRDQGILDGLETEGAYATNLDLLGAAGTAEFVKAADKLFDDMSRLSPEKGNKDYMIGARPNLITNYPDVLRWGLDE